MTVYIAVDGPAGSGKSATFSRAADILGFKFIDTGYFYRAFCWSILDDATVSLEDENALVQKLAKWTIAFGPNDAVYVGWSDQPEMVKEVHAALHTHLIDANVSTIAKHPGVREAMVRLQRQQAYNSKPCIVLGRDIGTVVLPDAPIKIYLDTSVEVRAQRRFAQLEHEAGVTYQEVYEAIRKRDETDKNRPVGPLVQADDAVYMNNDKMTLDDAVKYAVALIRQRLP